MPASQGRLTDWHEGPLIRGYYVPTRALSEEEALAEELHASDPSIEVYDMFPNVDAAQLALESAQKLLAERSKQEIEQAPQPIKTVYVVMSSPVPA